MIIHIDCNNFFVSCELVHRPELQGSPVVVANNNDNNGGIILALNKEAKDVGLKRGNPIFQIGELLHKHHVTVIDVHHNLYHEISRDIMETVAQTEMVLNFVQYSVDEFFGEMPEDDPTQLHLYLRQLKDVIMRETHIPVSCGAGKTYTLAKTATYYAKHYAGYQGICILSPDKQEKALRILAVEKIWGIGRRHIKRLKQYNIYTALDFARKPEGWIKKEMGVTGMRTWKELNGIPSIILGHEDIQKSIMYSRTFSYMINQKNALLREISNYANAASRRLRVQKALCRKISIFIATNRNREDLPQYTNEATKRLISPTDDTLLILETVSALVEKIYQDGYQYKQAGVILSDLQPNHGVQLDLFSANQTVELAQQKRLMKAVDTINRKFGSNQIHFAIQGIEAQNEEMAGFMRSKKYNESKH